jgi:RNA polymerase sigma-70 factor (family 1)
MKLINFNASDDELWESIKCGNHQAFKILFERYSPTLLATAKHYLKDENSCENIVQDIFLNLWLKRERLEIRDFKSYLKSATRYHVYKELKDKKLNSKLTFTEEHLENESAHSINSGEEWFNVASLKLQINAYLQMLPRRSREIFLMSREENLSNGEIAEKLNISKRSVENQITAALHHLRVNMKNYLFVSGPAYLYLAQNSSANKNTLSIVESLLLCLPTFISPIQ